MPEGSVALSVHVVKKSENKNMKKGTTGLMDKEADIKNLLWPFERDMRAMSEV